MMIVHEGKEKFLYRSRNDESTGSSNLFNKISLCSLKVKTDVLDFSSIAQQTAIDDQAFDERCTRCV